MLPVFLKLAGRRVLVVGGGPVAAAKLAGLRGTGAEIVLVAPAIGAPARAEIDRCGGAVTVVERPFVERDLDGAWLVVSAAPPEVNRQVAAAAEARRLFVIAVDDPAGGERLWRAARSGAAASPWPSRPTARRPRWPACCARGSRR